jgi:hypothetical protein
MKATKNVFCNNAFFVYMQPKLLHAIMAVPPAPIRVPSQLPRVSPQAHLSANDKGDNRSLANDLLSMEPWVDVKKALS